MTIMATLHNRAHKPVTVEVGGKDSKDSSEARNSNNSRNNSKNLDDLRSSRDSKILSESSEPKESNLFESGILLRAGKEGSVGSCMARYLIIFNY